MSFDISEYVGKDIKVDSASLYASLKITNEEVEPAKHNCLVFNSLQGRLLDNNPNHQNLVNNAIIALKEQLLVKILKRTVRIKDAVTLDLKRESVIYSANRKFNDDYKYLDISDPMLFCLVFTALDYKDPQNTLYKLINGEFAIQVFSTKLFRSPEVKMEITKDNKNNIYTIDLSTYGKVELDYEIVDLKDYK